MTQQAEPPSAVAAEGGGGGGGFAGGGRLAAGARETAGADAVVLRLEEVGGCGGGFGLWLPTLFSATGTVCFSSTVTVTFVLVAAIFSTPILAGAVGGTTRGGEVDPLVLDLVACFM
jgi:hypothetical protein